MLSIYARSVFEPSVMSGAARVTVLSKDDPEVGEVKVIGMSITPAMVEAGKNSQITFKAVVIGQNNPSQEVKWTMSGNTSAKTVISGIGVLTIAGDENSKVLVVKATSVADPNFFMNAYVTISEALSLPDTGIPDIPEAPLEQTYVRKRDKSGKAIWEKTPDDVPEEPTNADYVRTRDENGNVGWKEVHDIPQNPAGADYVRSRDENGNAEWKEVVVIEDVPEDGKGKQYIRTRNEEGEAEWKEVQIENGRGGYLGNFETLQDLMQFTMPEDAKEDDYVIVNRDEAHQNFPTIYLAKPDDAGVLHFVFDVVLGRPFILGDKLDILYVLDNGEHSKLLRDIEVLEDFDTNESRLELAESEAAWRLVTQLHKGFWDMIKHHPDRYKAITAISRETGKVMMYLTCFTDEEHEFVVPVGTINGSIAGYEEEIPNPRPVAPDTLNWTNTIQNGNSLMAMNNQEYVRYEFDWSNFTLSVAEQVPVEQEAEEPGVSPWATVVGQYTMLKNGEVIGPLEGVTDQTGYLWVANRESFMVGSAGDGTEMFCYNIDDDTWFTFPVPAGKKENYHFATDLNERYFMFWITSTSAVLVDRKQAITEDHKGTAQQITWHPSGYSGLSEPGANTRPSISVDGKYYLHTSTQTTTPMFSTFSFETGDFVTEATERGTSSSAIGLSDGRRVMSNTPEGQINLWSMDDSGKLTRIYYNTPEGNHRYVVVPTGQGDRLLFVKVDDRAPSSDPAWFVFNPDKVTPNLQDHTSVHDGVVSYSEHTDVWCKQTNPQGKGCAYRIDTNAGPCYLLTFDVEGDSGLLLQPNPQDPDMWYEHEMEFGGLGNDKHSYNQPGILDGSIIVTTNSKGELCGYDTVNHKEVDMSTIDPDHGGGSIDNNFVQIDNTHFAWCTSHGISIFRMTADGNYQLVIQIPENQAVVSGFGRRNRR